MLRSRKLRRAHREEAPPGEHRLWEEDGQLEPARSAEQRRADVRAKLEGEVDLWVASASADGEAYLIPVSFYWDGERLAMATPIDSRTGRNLKRAGWARVALGPTRDVVIIEGPLELIDPADIDSDFADRFRAKAGFDPRLSKDQTCYIWLRPERIQAWREVNELRGRDVMVGGRWLTP